MITKYTILTRVASSPQRWLICAGGLGALTSSISTFFGTILTILVQSLVLTILMLQNMMTARIASVSK